MRTSVNDVNMHAVADFEVRYYVRPVFICVGTRGRDSEKQGIWPPYAAVSLTPCSLVSVTPRAIWTLPLADIVFISQELTPRVK
jgi:hypothetical protein